MMQRAFDPASLRARITRRSWWVVRYSDGRTLHEWDGVDWSHIPRRGLVAVRLYCPNGQVAELGNTVEAGARLFQLKGATITGGKHAQTFQLVGLVTGLNGECRVAAWECATRKLVTFEDNVYAMRYEQIGMIAFDHVGVKEG